MENVLNEIDSLRDCDMCAVKDVFSNRGPQTSDHFCLDGCCSYHKGNGGDLDVATANGNAP